MVVGCVVVYGDAEGGSDGILTAIALADGVLRIAIVGVEMELELVYDLMSQLGQSVFLVEREHGALHGS